MLRVLGAPRIVTEDGTTTPITGTSALVLARLVAARGDIISTDRLLEDVWMGAVGEGTVRTSVSRLRSVLGPHRDAIVHTGGGYRFDHGLLPTDVIRFEQLVRTTPSLERDEDRPQECLAAALHDSSGRLFDGHEASFLDRERDQLLQLRLRTIEQTADPTRIGSDDVDEIARLAEEHPEREALVLIAAGGLARSGRTPVALRLCARHRKVVWEHWGVVPSEALDALERTLLGDPVGAGDDSTGELCWKDLNPSGSRPSGGRLVGRDVELAAVDRLLASRRIVSIVGLGGVGKTHLALEIGRHHADRTIFADFTHDESAEGVATTILHAFGLAHGELAVPLETKINQSIDEPTLVILDNCEQVADVVGAFVERMVSTTPHVTVLATARAPLAIADEFVFPLAPLPTRSDSAGVSVVPSPAFALLRGLVDHVDWAADPETGEDLVEAVGGLPLAVVLLARMLHSVSPDELRTTIDHDATLDPNHIDGIASEIRRIADPTVERLDPTTRQLFAALSCVPGRFDLGLATAIGPSGEPDPIIASRLRSLVEVGFVERDPSGSGLRMTALIRAYAAALVSDDERRRATTAMWQHLTEVVVAEDRRTHGADQARGLRVLEAHWPLVNGLHSAEIDDAHVADACTIACSMASFWFLSGRWAEGPAILRRLLDDQRVDDVRHRGRLVAAMATCTGTYAATAALLPRLRESIDALEPIAVDECDLEALATCHTYATSSSIWVGDAEGYLRHRSAAERLIEAHGFTHLAGWIMMFVGLRLRNDDRVEMRRLLHQARSHYLALGDRARAATVMLNLGMVMSRHGDLKVAESTLRECLDLSNGLAMRSLDAHAESQLAQIAARKGSPDAADDLRASRQTFVEMGDIGCLNVCDRMLAELASASGDDDEALHWLRDSLEAVAAVDQQEFALTLVEIAEIYSRQGRHADAAVVFAEARSSATGAGIGISDEQRQRMDDLAQILDEVPSDRELAIALAMM